MLHRAAAEATKDTRTARLWLQLRQTWRNPTEAIPAFNCYRLLITRDHARYGQMYQMSKRVSSCEFVYRGVRAAGIITIHESYSFFWSKLMVDVDDT